MYIDRHIIDTVPYFALKVSERCKYASRNQDCPIFVLDKELIADKRKHCESIGTDCRCHD